MSNNRFKILFFISILVVNIKANNYTCSDSRKIIINENHGFISDGPSNYSENVHCEWLIVAPDKSFISFHVLNLQTECLYDYLYVFNGNSYSGQLLGSLCGNQKNLNFTSPSEMLILLFSDANTVQQGFEAEFFVFSCPENCNNRGKCQYESNTCSCYASYSGISCAHETCLINQCYGHGKCSLDNEIYSCQCNDGYYGDSCSVFVGFNTTDSSNLLKWKLLTSSQFPPRTSHNMVYLDELSKIYIFNGVDLNNISNDLVDFNFASNKWTVSMGVNLNPRYGAGADEVPFGFAYYGGWISSKDLSMSNELHVYNGAFLQWLQPKPICQPIQCSNPPGLVYHTLTSIDETTIFIIGGITERYLFNEFVYKYNIRDNFWTKIVPKNYIGMNSLRFGHSTVYDKTLNCMIVFGGFVPQTVKLSFVDDSLLMFDVIREIWLHIKPSSINSAPIGRAFHSASLFNEFLVVFGGTTDTRMSNTNESCITDSVWLYNTCTNNWSPLSPEKADNETFLPRFGHSSVIINDNLVISGGYNGETLGDVRFVKLPSNENEFSILCQNSTHEQCLIYPQCAWCDGQNMCSRLSLGCSTGTTEPKSTNCKQNYCSAFKFCDECQIDSDTSCFWCEKTKQCLAAADATQCSNDTKVNCEPSINGMLISYFKPPLDANFPYKIAIVDHINVTFQFQSAFSNEKFFIGLGLHTIKGNFLLKLSKLSSFKLLSSNNLTIVSWKTATTSIWLDVKPITNLLKPIFTLGAVNEVQSYLVYSFNGSISNEYFLQIETSQKISLTNVVVSGFALKMNNEVISGDAIEPYMRKDMNESCSLSANCQLCVTNIYCVWNNQKSFCTNRSVAMLDPESRFLVLNPEMCYQCSHSINCSDCLKHDGCLWLLSEQVCIRRNSILQNQIATEDKCPSSCFSRTSCTSCIGTSDDCVWCKTSGTCFPFHLYQALFLFGKCRDWVNGAANDVTKVLNATKKCGDCSIKDTCGDCIQTFGCGSCSQFDDHPSDICLQGDFDGGNSCDQMNNGKMWNYTSCRGLDECASHSAICHEKADCINTDYGYTCKCKKGFVGDGVKMCDKTCDQVCVHGKCSSFPDYFCACDLGWTGDNCSVDCSCSYHSWCNSGIGHCDKCYNNTIGPNCGTCSPGSYGNATLPYGCQMCNCNGHGNVSLGICDSQTGNCFCTNDTEGDHCEFCRHNFFGDAQLNGICYAKCFGRTLITNIAQTGGIGMSEYLNDSENIYCVWILTTGPTVEVDPSSKSIIPLELTVESMNMDCILDDIVIYDGIPNFLLKSDLSKDQLIGQSCNFGQSKNLSTYFSANGLLTVIYNGHNTKSNVKFTARYSPVSCPYYCTDRRQCVNEICQCKSGFYGSKCEFQCGNECPNGCIFSETSKSCVCNEVLECSRLTTGSFLNLTDTLLSLSIRSFELKSSVMVADDKTKSLWIFGGYDYKTQSASKVLIKINLSDGTVSEITQTVSPNATFLHSYAVDTTQNGFFLYGGYGSNGDFYFFNFLTAQWTHLSLNYDSTIQKLPSLFGHTLTMTSRSLFIIGGYSLESGFNYEIFFCNTEKKIWRRIKPSGLNLPAIYAHTATYYEPTMSIFVYGGYYFDGTKMIQSNRLCVLNIVQQIWSLIPGRRSNPNFYQPLSVSFATTRIVSDYLAVVQRVDSFDLINLPKVQIYNIRDQLWNAVQLKKYNFSSFVLSKPIKPFNFEWKIATPYGRNEIYFLDTLNWKLFSIYFPNDACLLSDDCATHSCDICRISNTDNVCFNRNDANSLSCLTIPNSPQPQFVNKSQLDECFLRKTCAECISNTDSQNCQWCSEPCTGGMCYPSSTTCDSYSYTCSLAPIYQVVKMENCPESTCLRSDCESCIYAGNNTNYQCAFTKHVSKINSVYFNVTKQAKFPWTCIEYDKVYMSTLNMTILTTERCAKQCSSYTSCLSCAKANLENSRSENCLWLENLNQCISEFALPLLCSNGYCGRITVNQCSPLCETAKSCKECFEHQDCVWCSNGATDGTGFCKTFNKNVDLLSVNCKSQDSHKVSTDNFQLHTYECPAENECLNGRNDCDAESEFCVDLSNGFNCACKSGYERKLNKCIPVCRNACVHGFCIKPDVCQCEFGYTASTCNTACNCNGHSDCPGPDDLNTCIHCYNNTMGSHCQFCQPNFIPVDKQCLTCTQYCNSHSSLCSNAGDIFTTNAFNATTNNLGQSSLYANLICRDCANQTTGLRCNQCLDGYFRPANLPKTTRCIPCRCNGHGVKNYCDPDSGTNCTCTNNTFTPSCTGDSCWMIQCSKCKEYFRGTPIDGQQCFREIADGGENYCFSTGDSGHCLEETSLEYYQPAFYVLFPDFSNVDVRIIVDITSGSADVFLAIEDAFVVRKNDLDLNIVSLREDKYGPNADLLKKLQENLNLMNWRWLISTQTLTTINSFVQYTATPRILWLRNLTSRTTIIASTTDFDLQKTQFYLIIQSKSSKTIGNLVYIQDQARFELFIFLTVFCSCFVLFISLFVLFWQLKLSRGNNAVRDNETMEIQQLANRPFSRYSILFEDIWKDGPEKVRDDEEDNLSSTKCNPCCLQYLRDGRAAVGTLLVRLPGGKRAPVQLCLASALLLEQNKEEIKEETCNTNVQNANVNKSARRIFSLRSRNRIRPANVNPGSQP